jgi:hypothetical protein
MHVILHNRRKVVTKYLRNFLKKKNKVEEGGALGLGVKKEHETT